MSIATVTRAVAFSLTIAARAHAHAAQGMPHYCPPPNPDAVPVESEVIDSRTGLELVPRLQPEEALLSGDADQRLEAAFTLIGRFDPRPGPSRDAMVKLFITALSDPNMHVREALASLLRRIDTPEAEAALARAVSAPRTTVDPASTTESLIERVADPSIDVSVAAARALGQARSTSAVGALIAAVNRLDATRDSLSTIFNAFATIGSREALPTLERCAATARTVQVREAAARAYIDIAKPRNPGDEVRRLLWEPPDTELERVVLAQGRSALPLAQKALVSGTGRERRAAAALLGWFPDASSIPPILTAINRAGPVTRNQLLFDLNMILLTEGVAADADQRKILAAQHLQWMYGEIARNVGDEKLRSSVLNQSTIAVFPDRIAAPFSVDLSTQAVGVNPGQGLRNYSARAVASESHDAFREAVAGDACGVAFHAITVAHGVARVATTLYVTHGRSADQVWISLYHHEGDKWVPFMIPTYPVLRPMLDAPTLLPRIDRNYGGAHPLKVLRLDFLMEHMRVDPKAVQNWRLENIDIPGRASDLDASYAVLFDRYKRSDMPDVKYTAEYQSFRLGAQPDLQLWLDMLARPVDKKYLAIAQEIVGKVATHEIETEGPEFKDPDRDRLLAFALSPEPVNPDLLPSPQQRLRPENIRRLQSSSRFGLVDVGFGSGVMGQSGYSMLFERRGKRWVFLFVTKGWIS